MSTKIAVVKLHDYTRESVLQAVDIVALCGHNSVVVALQEAAKFVEQEEYSVRISLDPDECSHCETQYYIEATNYPFLN